MANSLVFDKPKKNDMDFFLKYIYQMKKSNPNLEVNKSLVYHELERYGLKNSDMNTDRSLKNNREFFSKWFDNFINASGIMAYCNPNWEYFFQFLNGNLIKKSGYIKLYIPIDFEHIYDGVNILMDYIRSLNIKHQSKVSEELRSDNVIIRLSIDDEYNAMKIINFVNSNPYLRSGLNRTNPFVPTIRGIGIMKEHGMSYNSEIATLISSYVNKSFEQRKDNVSLDDFSIWMKENNRNSEIEEIYSIASGNQMEFTSKQKLELFLDALRATFKKYDFKQVVCAIEKSLDGDYSYFTNGTQNSPKYRNLLIKSVSPNTIRVFIYAALEQIKGKSVDNVSKIDAIYEYCDYLFSESIMSKFEEACKVTLSKYGENQLMNAIDYFLNYDNATGFTRFDSNNVNNSTNYREMIASFSKKSILDAMRKSLILKGIDCKRMPDDLLIYTYSHELYESIYNENKKSTQTI